MPKIAIVGTGLIGTSIALGLKQARAQNLELVGADLERRSRDGAQKRKAFDRVEVSLPATVRDANLVVLATPVMAMRDVMETIAPNLQEGCIVTDVGSSKRVVLDWAEELLPNSVDFVGGHPMAGKESSGPGDAAADLFRGKAYCIIPGAGASDQAVSEVTALAEAVGAVPYFIGADEHDSYVAAVSHLPFMLSVALVGCTSKSANWGDIAQLASTGYKDLTRLASGDPVMHRDICITNPEAILAWTDSFIRELYEMRKLLANGEGDGEGLDGQAIHKAFQEASDARARWLANAVNPLARSQTVAPEIPSFTENLGRMLLGTKLMEAQKRMFGGNSDSQGEVAGVGHRVNHIAQDR